MSKEFKRGEAITVPALSIKALKEGDSLFIKVMGEMKSKEMTKSDGSPDTDENGKVKILNHVLVTDLSTGELGEMVLPFMVKQAFDDMLADGKTVQGASFELLKGKKKNRTNEWTVYGEA